MTDKEVVDLLEKLIQTLEKAGIDMAGDQKFFHAGERELALEGVYVAHRKNPGVLDARDVQALVDDFNMDTTEFDG